MILIPDRLLLMPEVQVLMQHGKSLILTKKLPQDSLDRSCYLGTHVFSLVRSGEQKITNYEGQNMRIRAEKGGFLSRSIYSITDLLTDGETFESCLFFVTDELLESFLAHFPRAAIAKGDAGVFFPLPTSPAIQLFLETLPQFAPKIQDPSGHLLRTKTLELLFLLAETPGNEHFIPYLKQLTLGKKHQLKSFLEANFDKPLKVEDYALLTGRSLSSFRRDFKRLFHQTPQQWLRQKRLEKAHELLTKAQYSVTEVALAVGYENVSHFIQAFRQLYGTSPKQMVMRVSED